MVKDRVMESPAQKQTCLPGPYWLLLIIIVLVISSYMNTMNSPAVLDDQHSFIFTSRMQLRDFSFSSFSGLRETVFGLKRILPITSLAVNNYLSKGRAPAYHITNIAIHLLTLLALIFFIRELLKTPGARDNRQILPAAGLALAVGGIWALNPVQTNAVTYIVQRMTSLCALFYLLSLGLYLTGRRQTTRGKAFLYITGALLAAVGAFLSKENSATIPITILLLEDIFIIPGRIAAALRRFTRRHWLLLTIILLLLAPLIEAPWERLVLGGYNGRYFNLTERLLTEARIVVWYITLLLAPLPSRMNLDHEVTLSHSLFSPLTTIPAIIVLILLLLTAVRLYHRAPLFSFGVLFFLLNLVMESSFIPLELLFEHRLYLPSAGLFLAVVSAGDLALTRLPRIKNISRPELVRILTLGMIIIWALLSMLTTSRNFSWRDKVSIYADMAEKSPNKPRALNNYGMALAEAGDTRRAIEVLNRAFAAGRPHNEAYYAVANNLFLAYKASLGFEEAVRRIGKLLEKIPDQASKRHLGRLAHNLAYGYLQNNDLINAVNNVRTALSIFPPDQNQLSLALYMRIIGRAWEDPELKDKLALRGDSLEEAAAISAIELLIAVRDYPKAARLNQDLFELNPSQADYFAKELERIQQLNGRARRSSDLRFDEDYLGSGLFRFELGLITFIQNNYHPLTPLIPALLRKAHEDFPNNPFINKIRLDRATARNREEAVNLLLKEILPTAPDFPPILLTAFDLTQKTHPDTARRIAEHLLTIYPDTPGKSRMITFLQNLPDPSPAKDIAGQP